MTYTLICTLQIPAHFVSTQIWDFVKRCPDASIFLIQDDFIGKMTDSFLAEILTKGKMVEHVLITALNMKHMSNQKSMDQWPSIVHKMPGPITSKFFDLIVGGERVNSNKVVETILNGQHVKVGPVAIDYTTWQEYEEFKADQRQYFDACLLQALTFYHTLTKVK